MKSAGAIESILRQHEIKPTSQRVRIGQLLLSRPRHMSAEQVRTELRDTGRPVSKATVYNTLNLFAEKGVVREVTVDPKHLVYDSTTSVHHHVFNADTGELIDIDSESLQVNGLPEPPAGTRVESVELIVRVRTAR